MGALPSREATESPNTVYFANNNGEVTLRLPLTPHYFPSASCLAFQQLFEARNSQSSKYSFQVRDLDGLAPKAEVEAFRAAQAADWGPEFHEADPSVHYYDAAPANDEGHGSTAPASAQQDRSCSRPSIEDAAALYDALVRAPTAGGQIVDTNAEMCALYAQEQRWLKAQKTISEYEKAQLKSTRDVSVSDAVPVAVEEARRVPPPRVFLAPLPEALVLQMSMDEVHEQVTRYRQKHGKADFTDMRKKEGGDAGRGNGRGRLHDDTAEDGTSHLASPQQRISENNADKQKKKRVGEDPDALEDDMNDPLDEEKLLSYPYYSDVPLPFEHDDTYMDGRIHIVEHEGVNYIFAYNPDYVRSMGKQVKVDASAIRPILNSDAFRQRRGWMPQAPRNGGEDEEDEEDKLANIADPFFPEDMPRLFSWANDAKKHVPRIHFTTTYEVATRRPEDFDADNPTTLDAGDPNQRRAYELLSAVYEKFYIPILPVRVIGMDGMLRTEADNVKAAVVEASERSCLVAEAGESNRDDHHHHPHSSRTAFEAAPGEKGNAAAEVAPPHVPVLRLCRFISANHGEKCLNRLALLGVLVHLERCLLAGLPDALVQPFRAVCPLSDVPALQFHREIALRYMSATLEIGFQMSYIRESLARGERWNDFIRFVNSPMYGFRRPVPPEKVFRHQEILTGGAVVAAMENKMTVLKNIEKQPRSADSLYPDYPSCDLGSGSECCSSEESDRDTEHPHDDDRHEEGENTHEAVRQRKLADRQQLAYKAVSGSTKSLTTSSVRDENQKTMDGASIMSIPLSTTAGSGREAQSLASALTSATSHKVLGPVNEHAVSRDSDHHTSSESTTSDLTASMLDGSIMTTATATTTQAMTPIFTEQTDDDGHVYKLARYCHNDFLLLREMTMLTRGIHTTVRGPFMVANYTAEACRNVSQALSRAAAPIISLPYIGRFPVAANLVFRGGIPAAGVRIPTTVQSIKDVVITTVPKTSSPLTASSAAAHGDTILAAVQTHPSTPVEAAAAAGDGTNSATASEGAKPGFVRYPNRRYGYACLPPPGRKLQHEIAKQYAKGLIPCFVVCKMGENFFLNPHQGDTTVSEVLSARGAPTAAITATLAMQMEAVYLFALLYRMAHAGRGSSREANGDKRKGLSKAKEAAKHAKKSAAVSTKAKAAMGKKGMERQFVSSGSLGKEGEHEHHQDDNTNDNGATTDDTATLPSSPSFPSTNLGGSIIHSANHEAGVNDTFYASALHNPIPTFDGDVVVMCPASKHWIPLRTFQQLVRLVLAEKNCMSVDATDPIWRGVSEKADRRYRHAMALAKEKAMRQVEKGAGAFMWPANTNSIAPNDSNKGGAAVSSSDDDDDPEKDPRLASIFNICGGGHCCCATGLHGRTVPESGGNRKGNDGVSTGNARKSSSAEEEEQGGEEEGNKSTGRKANGITGQGTSDGNKKKLKAAQFGSGTPSGAVADSQLFPDINYNKLFEPSFIKRIKCRLTNRMTQEHLRYNEDPFQMCRLESPVRFYGLLELLFAWNNSVLREERFENKDDPGWLHDYRAVSDDGEGMAGAREGGGAGEKPHLQPPILQKDGFCIWSFTLEDGLGHSRGALANVNVDAGASSSGGDTDAGESDEEAEMAAAAAALTHPLLRPFTNEANKRLRFFLGTKPAFQRRQVMRKRLNKRRKESKTVTAAAVSSAAAGKLKPQVVAPSRGVQQPPHDDEVSTKSSNPSSSSPGATPAPHAIEPPKGLPAVAASSFSHFNSLSGSGSNGSQFGARGFASVSTQAEPPQQQPVLYANGHHDSNGGESGRFVNGGYADAFPPPPRRVSQHNPYINLQEPAAPSNTNGNGASPFGAFLSVGPAKPRTTTSPGRTVVLVNLDQARAGNGEAPVAEEEDESHIPRAYRGSRQQQVPFPPPPAPVLPPSAQRHQQQ